MKKMILIMSTVVCFGIANESRANCDGCIGECTYVGWGYNCTNCKDGYVLTSAYNGHTCVKICSESEFRYSLDECAKIPTCNGGSACKDSSGNYLKNCCYKTEGNTTTMYPDDKKQVYEVSNADIPDNNKTLVLENGAKYMDALVNKFETVYIGENSTFNNPYGGWCANEMPTLKHLILPDSGVGNMLVYCSSFTGEIVCLGDLDECKSNYIESISKRAVSPTETQCNGSGSYYFTGSSCEHRPTDGTDITCEHELSGYVKVGNYCVSPENSYAKKHYTPAEAAQWLHDGNDNFVVITFKK